MKKPILFLSALLLTFSIAQAQVPGTLSYQGILVDGLGDPVANGNHFVQFHFYTVLTGGTPVYSSTGTGSGNTVVTFKGMFTFTIGSGTAGNTSIPSSIFDQQLYVEVIADAITQSPRIQLTTVPYAVVAQSANTADAAGLTGTVANSALDVDLQDLADGTLTGSKVDGTTITSLNASNISSGTLADARLSTHLVDLADGTLTGSKVGTGIAAGNITSGTLLLANGGTGASTAAAARTNLGLVIGTDVQAFDADLTDLADGTLSGSKVDGATITALNAGNITSGTLGLANGGTGGTTAATARTNLGLGSLATLSTIGSSEITNASIAAADLSPMGAASNQVMMYNGSIWTPTTLGAGGTVSSVDLSLPSIFSVSGNPITTSGTLTATLTSQTANTFFGSPNGAAGSPSFRALVAADIPNLDAGKITTGTIALANGGTGAATAAAARTNLGLGSLAILSTVGSAEITNASIGVADLSAMGAGSNQVMMYNGSTWIPTNIGGGGTVSSVDLALPSIFSVSGNPVTTSGTLTAALTSQSANTIFSAPNGSAGAPTFRLLVAADIPNHDASKITSGTIAIANGGTNAATAGAARTNLGLVIGTDVQAFDADLTDLADGVLSGSKIGTGIDASFITLNTLALANGGTGAGTASAARTNLGLIIGTDVQAFDADLTDLADGVLSGSKVGTGIDASFITLNTLALVYGGTGSGTASGARTNLGLIIGTDVQAFDADLTDLADGSLTGSKVGTGIAGGNITDATILTAKIADDAVTAAKIGTAGAADADKILTTDASGNPQWELKTTVAASGSGTAGYVTLWSGTNTLATSGTGTSAFFWDNGTSRLGLGTTSPNRRLTISGTGGVENDILVESFSSTLSASGTIRYTKAAGTIATPTTVLANDILGSVAFAGYTGSIYSNAGMIQGLAETSFNSAVNGSLLFNTAASGTVSEKMRITSAGNVGIGTNTPNASLHTHLAAAANNKIRISNSATGAGVLDGLALELSGDMTTWLWNYENSSLRFGTNNLDRMIINNLGNVGIGTIAPLNKLDIEGGAVIGATYSGTNTAPANGLLMEGNLGIGTTTATYPLNVYNLNTTRGVFIENDYAGASAQYGMTVDMTSATGSSTKYGIDVNVSGTTGSGASILGLETDIVPNGTGVAYGVNSSISGVGTGTRYGFYNSVVSAISNTSDVFGVYNTMTNSGTGITYGVQNFLSPTGNGITLGTTNRIDEALTLSFIAGTRVGTYNNVGGDAGQANQIYGQYNHVTHNGTGTTYGAYLNVNKAASQSGTVYGFYVDAGNDGTGSSYLIRGNSSGLTTGTEYGVYISGEDVNYFDGKVGINTLPTTTTTADLWVRQSVDFEGIKLTASDAASYWDIAVGAANDNLHLRFGGATTAYVDDVTGNWTAASDARLKENIGGLEKVLPKLLQLNPKTYNFIRDANKKRAIGLIAQEVLPLFPEVVQLEDDGYYSMSYSDFGVLSIQGIKELNEIVTDQQSQIDQLKSEIESLRKLISSKSVPVKAETSATSSTGKE